MLMHRSTLKCGQRCRKDGKRHLAALRRNEGHCVLFSTNDFSTIQQKGKFRKIAEEVCATADGFQTAEYQKLTTITNPGWHNWQMNYAASTGDGVGLVADGQSELWAETRLT